MFPAPHYREHLSLMVSEVLDDIGVNEQMVMRRRKYMQMKETLRTFTVRSTGTDMTSYVLGSRSEGTTTTGLQSDLDYLVCDNTVNVIKDLSEWKHDKLNYLMIQDKNTSPGYCFLQLLQYDKPTPATEIPYHHILKGKRILLKNTIKCVGLRIPGYDLLNGPSNVETRRQYGLGDVDNVLAYSCKSWPQSASSCLERQGTRGWPTTKVRRSAARTKCFVVPTGSKISVYPELEWRISTSLAERCLISSLKYNPS